MLSRILAAVVALGLLSTICSADPKWLSDFEEAKKKAKKEKKAILFKYTDSAHCMFCKKMDQYIFDTIDFENVAKEMKFVLFELDVPTGEELEKLDPEVRKEREALRDQYRLFATPTTLYMSADGEPFNMIPGFNQDQTTMDNFTGWLKKQEERRAEWDKIMKKAKGAKGDGRAKLLDEALELLTFPSGIVQHKSHNRLIREVIDLDKDNKLSLREKYATRIGELEMLGIKGMFERNEGSDAMKRIERLFKEPFLKSIRPEYIQNVLLFRASYQAVEQNDRKAAIRSLQIAQALGTSDVLTAVEEKLKEFGGEPDAAAKDELYSGAGTGTAVDNAPKDEEKSSGSTEKSGEKTETKPDKTGETKPDKPADSEKPKEEEKTKDEEKAKDSEKPKEAEKPKEEKEEPGVKIKPRTPGK